MLGTKGIVEERVRRAQAEFCEHTSELAMSSINRLRGLLHRVLERQDTHSDIPALFDELRTHAPTLLNLLHVGPLSSVQLGRAVC